MLLNKLKESIQYNGVLLMTVEINIEKTFNSNLRLKITVRELFNMLEDETEAILNFKGVNFVSRDFAWEYVLQKCKTDIKITEINMHPVVEDIMKKVEKEYRESSE